MNKNQQQVVQKRFCIDGETTWKEVAERATSIMKGDYIKKLEFVPAGRILRGIGSTTEENSLFNCSAIKFENVEGKGVDSRKAIMTALNKVFELEAKGTGTGLNFSSLRPRATKIKKVMGKTGGVVSWMKVTNELLRQISQGGEPDGMSERKGAFMALLDIWHPDIFNFLQAKDDISQLTCMNISVNITNEFIEAIENDENWTLEFPDTTTDEYDRDWNGDIRDWKKLHYPVIVYDIVKARELLYQIAEHAWRTGEPGVIFLDRANEINFAPNQKLQCCNPCSEEVLDNEFCNLGHINLTKVINDNGIDYNKLKSVVEYGVRYLTKVATLNKYDFEDMRLQQLRYNKIGLGVMGFADALIMLNLRYGSEESLRFIDKLMGSIKMFALAESNRMVVDGEVSRCYDVDDGRVIELNDFIPEDLKQSIRKHGLGHSRLLTVAPTGTVAQLAGVSHGIEPNFAFVYERRDGIGSRLIKHHLYDKLNGVVNDDVWVTAMSCTAEEHIAVQERFQKYMSGSISKTINLSHMATIKDVYDIYLRVFNSNVIGTTIYRDGCREGVVLFGVDENEFCPECGFKLQADGSCHSCPVCGWSKCEI